MKTADQIYTEELYTRLIFSPDPHRHKPQFLTDRYDSEIGAYQAAACGRKIDHAYLLPGTERYWFHEEALNADTHNRMAVASPQAQAMTLLGAEIWRGSKGAAMDFLCSGLTHCGYDPLAGVDERGQPIGVVELLVLTRDRHREITVWVERFGLTGAQATEIARKVEARIGFKNLPVMEGMAFDRENLQHEVVSEALRPRTLRSDSQSRPNMVQMIATNLCALAACGAQLGSLFRGDKERLSPVRSVASVYLEAQMNAIATFNDRHFDTAVRALRSLCEQGFSLNGALHEACFEAQPGLVGALLLLDADPQERDTVSYRGQTPQQVLSSNSAELGPDRPACARLLASAIARKEALCAIETMRFGSGPAARHMSIS